MIFKNKGSLSPKRAMRTNPTMIDLRNKVSFDIPPTNPQADITATRHWILDHNHWSHGVSRKECRILPRWHYASWSVHWHSSLYWQCRKKESVKVCLLPSAFTYCKRPLIWQSAAAYTATLNLHPLALHQNSQASLHVKTPLHLNIRTKKSKTLSPRYSPPIPLPPFKSGP